MTRQSRKVLRDLKRTAKDNEPVFDFVYNKNAVCLSSDYSVENPYSFEWCKNDFRGILQYLDQKGSIKLSPDENHFEITHKGLNFLEITIESIFAFCFKSFLVPIIVALVTSILYNTFF